MKTNILIKSFSICIICCCLMSCRTHHDKKSVELALQQYDHLIQNLDADSIALLYTPDGKMGEMATGRDSIRAFLASFKNIQVLSQHSTSDSLTLNGDTALQKGIYMQTDVISQRDTVTVKGEYKAMWQWVEEGWHIKQMETKPLDMKKQ